MPSNCESCRMRVLWKPTLQIFPDPNLLRFFTMNKNDVAAILDEIGTLLEIQGENQFRCNAYHNAARTIANLERDLEEIVKAGELGSIPGVGETLREKITTLVTTGRLPFYEELKQKTPAGVVAMLRIP